MEAMSRPSQSLTPALSDDVLPPKPIEIRKRNRVFTSVALHRRKEDHSRSGSVDEQPSFAADIKSKSKPKLTAMQRHMEWLARKQQRQASVLVIASRVNLLDEMKCRLPPLRTIAEESIRTTLRHHTPSTATGKSRTRISTTPAKLSPGMVYNSSASAPRNNSPAQKVEVDMVKWLESDQDVLKEFSYCIPDLNVYLIKLHQEEELRRAAAVRKWHRFPSEVTKDQQ